MSDISPPALPNTSMALPAYSLGTSTVASSMGSSLRPDSSFLMSTRGRPTWNSNAFAAHRLHENRQVQQAAAGNLNARLVLKLLDAHGDVALLLAHQALLELARSHDVALAADERAGRCLEHDGHRGLFHLDGIEAHGVLATGHHVADVSVFHAHHGHDVAGVHLLLLLLAQRLEREHLLDVGVVARAVVLDDQRGLAFMDGAGGQAPHADAADEAGMVDGADLQRHRAVRRRTSGAGISLRMVSSSGIMSMLSSSGAKRA